MDDSKKLYVILTGNAASYRAATKSAAKDTRDFAEDLDDLGDSSRRLSTELNSMSGRLGLVVDGLALIGPAVVPITAIAIPALSALANLGFAAAMGAGASALAFIGLGDALGALSEYELEPSADNFAKLQEAMEKLPEAAQVFALELDAMLPRLNKVREAAAEGFFPGALEGLEEVERILPRVSSMVREYADSVGDVLGDAGAGLSSQRGRGFLRFIEGEARPAITGLYDVVANLMGGMSELWQVMDPANDDFLDWLVDGSARFDEWAQNLRKTNGAQEFLDYLHDTGPEVAEAAGAIANGLLQILEAAAPMGGVVLDGLELVGDALANIADSPIGPTIFAGLAAITALNRGLQVTSTLMTKAGLKDPNGGAVKASPGSIWGSISAQSTAAAKTVNTNVTSMRRDLDTVTRGRLVDRQTAGATSIRSMERQAAATARLRAQTATMARGAAGGAAGLGALAVMSTEAGQSLGVTNTAMLGMVGTMLGPWGAAAGAALGTVLDSSAAYGEWEDAVRGVSEAIADADFRRMYDDLSIVKTEAADVEDGLTGFGDVLDTIQKDMGATFSGDWNRANTVTEAAEESEDAVLGMERAVNSVGIALDESFGKDDLGRNVLLTLEDMDSVVSSAAPAMRDLGYTWEQLAAMDPAGQRAVGEEIRNWIVDADSADGRLRNVGEAIEDLGNEALSTADSADQLRTALEALLSPAIENEAAFDGWRASLKGLREDLKADAGFTAQNEAARENRALTRDYYETSMGRLESLANMTDTTEKDMARAVRETREEFIRSGVAAGFSREQMVARAKEMGLTPKLVRTVFEAAGVTEADLKLRELKGAYKTIPKKVRSTFLTDGIPTSMGQVDKLVEKYDLTEKQRTALVTLKDLASGDLEDVLALLTETGNRKPVPTVGANTSSAVNQLLAVLGLLDRVDGKTAVSTVYTKHVSIGGPQPLDGGGPAPTRGAPTKPTGKTPETDYSPRMAPTTPTSEAGGTYGGTTTIIRQGAPLVGSLTVPESSGDSDGRAHRVASAVVREVSLAQRSGRWSSTGDD